MAHESSISVLGPSKEKTNGTKLARLIVDGATVALRQFFDKIHPPSTLQTELLKAKPKLKLYQDQKDILFPPSGSLPDSKSFDITLLSLLLRTICGLKAPKTGWHDKPDDSDKSDEANLVRLKKYRDEIAGHRSSTAISDSDFERKWMEISESMVDLRFDKDEIRELKDGPIEELEEAAYWSKLKKDVESDRRDLRQVMRDVEDIKNKEQKCEEDIEELKHGVQEMQDRFDEQDKESVKSSICDPPANFIGRREEIERILKYFDIEKAPPLVLIYGGPGFGKTSLAKIICARLVKELRKTVIFCNMREHISSEDDIARTIMSEIRPAEVQKNPKHALYNWANQLGRMEKPVILVLDNAEDALEEPLAQAFETLLEKLRNASQQNINFLVTSRTRFKFEMPMEVVKLDPLSPNEGIEIISSIVRDNNPEIDEKRITEEEKSKLAELCGNVPLALCIAGSLLRDFYSSAEDLISRMEVGLIDVLKDPVRVGEHAKVEKTIEMSFEKLETSLQNSFIRMAVFVGPFTHSSLQAVLKQGDAVDVLQKLLRRSLIEKDGSNRYSIHPLIHAFVIKVGHTKAEPELKAGEQNFLKHYKSLIWKYSELYWSKDGSKESISMFVDDRKNFEHALRLSCMSSSGPNAKMWTEDEEFTTIRHLTLYLRSCISVKLLENVTKFFLEISKSDDQLIPQQVELLCILAHERRRKCGNNDTECKKYVQEAKKLHDSHTELFEENTKAKAYYLNCYGRFLSSIGQREKAKELFKYSEKLCEKELKANNRDIISVDLAEAAIELGHNAKHTGEYDLALEKSRKAVELRQTFLGKHTLTAWALKDLVDCLYTVKKETSVLSHDDFVEILSNYKYALNTITALGNSERKELILLLKNYAITFIEFLGRDSYEPGKIVLEQALAIAEKELEGDHKWKVWVGAELAILLDKVGDKRKFTVANKALGMGKRLNFNDTDWRLYKSLLQEMH